MNCSGFTDEEIKLVAGLRCGLASLACLVLIIVLVALVIISKAKRTQLCGSVVRRLAIWLTAVTVVYEFVLALSLVNYFIPIDEAFCEFDGFMNQYFGSVQLVFALVISFIVFAQTTGENWAVKLQQFAEKKAISCTEVVFVLVVFIFPALFDWIPFITNSYGSTGPWCWIRNIEEDCTENTAGLDEQIALWTVPFGLVALVTLALVIIALCWLCYASCKFRIRRGILDSLPSLATSLFFLFFTVVMYTLEVAMRSYSFYHNDLGTWKAYAVSAPLGQLTIPLALLVAIYLPLSCKCKSQSQIQEEFEATNPTSSFVYVPSKTNWECPHSDTASEVTPLVQN